MRVLHSTPRVSIGWLAVFMSALALVAGIGAGSMQLASMLGISSYAAKKVIDILLMAWNIWSVIGIIAAITGVGAIGYGVLATAKALAVKYGRSSPPRGKGKDETRCGVKLGASSD